MKLWRKYSKWVDALSLYEKAVLVLLLLTVGSLWLIYLFPPC